MGTKGYFNPEKVSETAKALEKTYFGVMESVIEEMQNSFVNPIAELWHGKDAVRVMGIFATKLNSKVWGAGAHGPSGDKYVEGIEGILKSAIYSVDSAGRRWAADSEITDEYVSVVSSFQEFTPDYKLKVADVIKEKKEDGSSGMDIAGVTEKLPILEQILSTVESHLTSSITAVENSGFLEDYGIETSLVDSITNHKDGLTKTINDFMTELKMCIEQEKTRKEETFAETKSAFSGGISA